MKLVSWNVNGLRSILGKGFHSFLDEANADVICLQEIKARKEQVTADFGEYEVIWNSADRPGYAGTAILTRKKPLAVTFGINKPEHDSEERVITADYGDFFLVNVYVPNSQRALTRLNYRTKNWGPDFLAYLKNLELTKPVIVCGDLNVAHKEIDLARPKQNTGTAGFTPEERADFELVVAAGFLDTFRIFEPAGGHYTWWSYQSAARERNIGWRIDYFCISPSLKALLTSAFIWPHILGSDHCPVGITLG